MWFLIFMTRKIVLLIFRTNISLAPETSRLLDLAPGTSRPLDLAPGTSGLLDLAPETSRPLDLAPGTSGLLDNEELETSDTLDSICNPREHGRLSSDGNNSGLRLDRSSGPRIETTSFLAKLSLTTAAAQAAFHKLVKGAGRSLFT